MENSVQLRNNIEKTRAHIDSIIDVAKVEKSIDADQYHDFLIEIVSSFRSIKPQFESDCKRFLIGAIRTFLLELLKEYKFYRKYPEDSSNCYYFEVEELIAMQAISFNFQALLT
jgi:hypothetical protein